MTFNSLAFYPNKNSPLHIGIIPDGGRRWAKEHQTSLTEAYDKSKEMLQKMADFYFAQNVDTLSIYVASHENFKRSEEEKSAFSNVVEVSLQTDFLDLAHRLQVKIMIVGDRKLFANSLLTSVEKIETDTADYIKGEINLCIGYHPVLEIQRAIEKSIHPENFLKHLDIKKPLNFIIRTGDANVLSNFLPLQSGFARIYFIKKLFNDLTMDNVFDVYQSYLSLNLKYGE